MPFDDMDLAERLARLHPRVIDLSLGRIERLLNRLGNPENNLPPVIHVAGTNGKGSVIAFMRAIAEAANLRVHVYTSPHLIRFNERIRLAGAQISDSHLLRLLEDCEKANGDHPITFFEMTTALAFLAFSQEPADLVLLETGLGGRLDATNVIAAPAATVITPVSVDHVGFLGDDIAVIAAEKAAIMRPGVPSVVARQTPAVASVIADKGADLGADLRGEGRDWGFKRHGEHLHLWTDRRQGDFTLPNLAGAHQLQNAAQAVAALDAWTMGSFTDADIDQGLQAADWPGRLQRLTTGPLTELLPGGWELWLDGGHNPAAGEVLAAQAGLWRDKPLHAVIGMISTKDPDAFLSHLVPHLERLQTIAIDGEEASLSADELAQAATAAGLTARPQASLQAAVAGLADGSVPARILICGSLYLAGQILRDHG